MPTLTKLKGLPPLELKSRRRHFNFLLPFRQRRGLLNQIKPRWLSGKPFDLVCLSPFFSSVQSLCSESSLVVVASSRYCLLNYPLSPLLFSSLFLEPLSSALERAESREALPVSQIEAEERIVSEPFLGMPMRLPMRASPLLVK